jgi:SAM-dependent MidA family methyltransferase
LYDDHRNQSNPDKTGLVRSGLVRSGFVGSGLVRSGFARAGKMLKLPAPAPEHLGRSDALLQRILADIAAHGPMSFARFMDYCLYEPGMGYYSADLSKFSGGLQSARRGDFITAPELGSLFAHTLARTFAPVFQQDRDAVLLEIGAGTGAFASDVLDALQALKALPAKLFILERSADLRARQQSMLRARQPEFYSRVQWLDAPPDAPWRGVLFANEVMDALAFSRFVITDQGPHALLVGADESAQLCDVIGPALPPSALHEAFSALPIGYCSEQQPQLTAWLQGLTQCMQSGLVLLIDYGYPRREYYLAERTRGTLVCHYQHLMFDQPYIWPGLVDISCSVDFTAVAEAADAAGLRLESYLPQGQLLLAAGLEEVLLARDFENMPQLARSRLSAEVRKLTLPGEMGERMQAVALSKTLPEQQLHQVFRMPDWRHRL